MQIIKKYVVSHGNTTAMMGVEAEILCAQRQGNSLCLWTREEVDAPKIGRTFFVLPTGQQFAPVPMKYIDTVQMGEYVWHIFEKLRA